MQFRHQPVSLERRKEVLPVPPYFTPDVATRDRIPFLERPELTGGQAAPSDVLFPHHG